MNQIGHYFFDFALLQGYWLTILQAFLVTIEMSALTVALGILLGLAITIVRLYRFRPINALIILYIDIFRSIPQLVLIVLAYFALPRLHMTLQPFAATVLALTLVLSAFAEEIFWASINAVPKGQWEAGRSTGLGFNNTLWHVVIPQAIRMSIPPLTNRAIAISKATTLGSVVAVPELLNVTSSVQSNIANPTALTAGALLFLLLFLPFVRFTRWLERVYARKR